MAGGRPPRYCHACGAPQLTKEQRVVLEAIAAHPGVTVQTLVIVVPRTKSTISYHVMGLRKAGLVRTDSVEGDARTERLFAVAQKAHPVDVDWLRTLDAALEGLQHLRARLREPGASQPATNASSLAEDTT